jgi:hypothetical protein
MPQSQLETQMPGTLDCIGSVDRSQWIDGCLVPDPPYFAD